MSRLRGGVLASLGALTIACFVVIGASAASSPQRAKSKFTKQDRAALARQAARGEHVVSLLIATPRGRHEDVAQSVRALGGTVAYRNDKLGYMRVRVPIRKADQASRLSGIQTINVDTVIPLSDPPPAGSQNPTPQPPPGADTPRVNPYMPTKDTGAAQFVNAHPTWDGRDTTIGILDTGVDLDNPVVNVTSTGQRKIVDWVTYTDPLTDGDPTWRHVGRHRERRRRRIHRVRHCVHRRSRGRHVPVRSHAGGPARRGERVRHRLRRRPQPKRRLRRLLRHPLAGLRTTTSWSTPTTTTASPTSRR